MATLPAQPLHHAQMPYFVTIVDTTVATNQSLKIPTLFREIHMKGDHRKEASLLLEGLPGNAWKVRVVQEDNDKCLARGWVQFVRVTCGVQRKVTLLFKYEGRMTFSVIRFGEEGQVLYFLPWLTATNPWNHCKQIIEMFHGFALNTWGPGDMPPVIGYGSLFRRLIEDGVIMGKVTFELHHNRGPYWMTEATLIDDELVFGHGWQHFHNAIALDRNKCALFKYEGNLAFSVLVFNLPLGTVAMDNIADPRNGGYEADIPAVQHDPVAVPIQEYVQEEVLVHDNLFALPSCLLAIQRGHGAFPSKFAVAHLGGLASCLTIRRATGGQWDLTTVRTNGTLYLSRGYADFKNDNQFHIGDKVRCYKVGEGTLLFA